MDDVDLEFYMKELKKFAKDRNEIITSEDRSRDEITELIISRPGSLKGIKDYKNLESLVLECGTLDNLDELRTLRHLHTLSISVGKVKDPSAIGELTTLTDLHFMDFRPVLPDISKLTNLTVLSVAAQYLKDIGCLSGLTGLKEVKLQCCKLADITPLKSLVNLEKLDLFGNKIADVSVLSSLHKLTVLKLSRNDIADLTPIAGLRYIKSFNISDNPIDWKLCGLTELRFSPCLEELDLSDTGFWATGDLALCPGLKKLRLRNNGIEYIYFLSHLPELELLDLWDNPVFDLSPIAGLHNLCDLTVKSKRDAVC